VGKESIRRRNRGGGSIYPQGSLHRSKTSQRKGELTKRTILRRGGCFISLQGEQNFYHVTTRKEKRLPTLSLSPIRTKPSQISRRTGREKEKASRVSCTGKKKGEPRSTSDKRSEFISGKAGSWKKGRAKIETWEGAPA